MAPKGPFSSESAAPPLSLLAPGLPGERGTPGLPGPKGDDGKLGATGPMGMRGFKGNTEVCLTLEPHIPSVLEHPGSAGVGGPGVTLSLCHLT